MIECQHSHYNALSIIFPLMYTCIYFFLFIFQGNYMGATENQLASMSKTEHDSRLDKAYRVLIDSGAHYVIDSVNDILPVIDDINRRLAQGEKP